MRLLGCQPPTMEPRATAHVPAMVSTVEQIIANGHAYVVDGGDVFFDVASLPGYGRLSRHAQVQRRDSAPLENAVLLSVRLPREPHVSLMPSRAGCQGSWTGAVVLSCGARLLARTRQTRRVAPACADSRELLGRGA